jgi:hypothetical protein
VLSAKCQAAFLNLRGDLPSSDSSAVSDHAASSH